MKFKYFATTGFSQKIDIALLLIRIVVGIAFMFHGYGKIQNPFGWMGPDSTIPGILQALAALSEFGGGLALVIGLLTSLASLGIAFTMIGAVYLHAVVMGDPFVNMTGGGSYELSSVYLVISLFFILAGAGRYSLDRMIFGTK